MEIQMYLTSTAADFMFYATLNFGQVNKLFTVKGFECDFKLKDE